MTAAEAQIPEAGAAAGLYCPHCGYDLRTLATDACPECGGAVDLAALKRSQIPWTHRDEIGFVRGFWRTAWRVTFKTQFFSHEVARPVDLAEAKRFRLWVVLWLAIGMMLPGAIHIILARTVMSVLSPVTGQGIIAFVIPAFVLLGVFLYGFTGLHTYWFHPHHLDVEQQNRAVALSYYACAPLAYLPLFVWMVAIGFWIATVADDARSLLTFNIAVVADLLAGGAAIASIIAFWRVAWVMVRFAALRGPWGQLTLVLGLPLAWVFLALLIFGLLPGAIGYVGLIV